MDFSIDLPPAVETRLYQEASRQGVPAKDIARRLIEENLPAPAVQDKTAELFTQWAAEDAKMTPEEIAAEDAAYAEIEAGMHERGLSLRVPSL